MSGQARINPLLGGKVVGANPWWYIVDYEADVNAALQSLREREFQAGRYFPAIDYIDFPLSSASPAPGAQHSSIEAAIEAADADGTQSILDIQRVSESKLRGTVTSLEALELLNVFGTETPTSDSVDEEIPNELFDFIDRGQAVYVVLFENSSPSKLLFVGYSYD
jgi:hypothetical protein